MVEVGVPPSAVAQKMAADCIDQVQGTQNQRVRGHKAEG
jgi:hypothetical protein